MAKTPIELIKEINKFWLPRVLRSWATMQAAIFYLDPAQLPRFNEIMARRYIPIIFEKVWTIPMDNDGV